MAGEYDDSFLTRAIEDARLHVDEPAAKAKYTDAVLIRRIEEAYASVLSEIHRNSREPVVARVVVTIDSTEKTAYTLPYTIGSIVAIYETNDSGMRVFYNSRNTYNPLGKQVWVEGNTLRLQSSGILHLLTEVTVEYKPSGTARLHNGTCTLNETGDVVTFGATPNAGTLDTHENSYAGSIFRILTVTGDGATGNFIQERTIKSYDNTTRQATLEVALSPIPAAGDGGAIYYEIAPAVHRGVDSVVGLWVAYTIAGVEGYKRADSILKLYRQQMRNIRLDAYYSNLQNTTISRGLGRR